MKLLQFHVLPQVIRTKRSKINVWGIWFIRGESIIENLALKIRLSALWIFFAVANSAHYAMYVFELDALQKILSEEMTLRRIVVI